MVKRPQNIRSLALAACLFVFVGIGLEICGRLGLYSNLAFPLPSGMISALCRLVLADAFIANWASTLGIWGVSLLLGLLIGVTLGFLAGMDDRVSELLTPFFGYFRSIPPIALFPVALIAIGSGSQATGTVASLAVLLNSFPIALVAAREAVLRHRDLAVSLGATRRQFLMLFVAPSTATAVLAGSRIAATLAFAVCVAGEILIGGRRGVGSAILELSERYRLEEAYAYIFCAGLVGVVIDSLFAWLAVLIKPTSGALAKKEKP